MTISLPARAVMTLLPLLGFLCVLAPADDHIQLLGTEPPVELPMLSSDPEQNKLVLTAGSSSSEDSKRTAPQIHLVDDGSSSRRTRRAAEEALGLHRLPWQNRQFAQSIVDEVSVFRRLPAYRSELDPRVHDFFTDHPEVAVSMWRAMGVSQVQMWQTSEWSYGMDTRDGTTGTINVLYRSRESCLIVCSGMFKSPFLQNAIAAKSLIHLRTGFSQDESGRTFATHQADLFVTFPSQKIETVAKLVSPVSNVIIDRNFQEISLFLHIMGIAMSRQPGWVEELASNLEGIEDNDRKQLIKLTAQVYVDTQTELQRRSGNTVTLESIRPPVRGSQKRGSSPLQTTSGEFESIPD